MATLIQCENGQEVLSTDIDHIQVIKDSNGTITCSFITTTGKKYPINYDDIVYFNEQYNIAIRIASD